MRGVEGSEIDQDNGDRMRQKEDISILYLIIFLYLMTTILIKFYEFFDFDFLYLLFFIFFEEKCFIRCIADYEIWRGVSAGRNVFLFFFLFYDLILVQRILLPVRLTRHFINKLFY